MSITIGDLVVNLSTSTINSALGTASPIKITFSNASTTSPGYNLTFSLILPDGVSFVSAGIPDTSITYSGYNQVVTFANIKDLYPNESYLIDASIMVDELYRGTGLPVPFNTAISGVSVDGTVDSMPRGNVDPGNIKVSANATATATGLRYSFKIVFPPVYLKGAGLTLSDPATNPFDISYEIINNTRESSAIDSIVVDLANGIRYIDTNYSVTGPNSTEFQSPIVTPIGTGNNNYKITFNNVNLSAGSTNTVAFQGAIWNNLTDNGVVNSGNYISNNTSLTSQAYTAYAGEYQYEYAAVAALELYIEKLSDSKTTDVSQVNNFTLNYQLGEYSTLNNILLYDFIGNGLSYDVGSVSYPYTSLINLGNGITRLSWDLGSLSSSASSSITLSATTLAQYFDGTSISAGDTLTNTMEAVFTDPTTGQIYTTTSKVNLDINIPTVTKTITGYFTEAGIPKTVQNATKGDYVGFLISYDSTGITAVQNNIRVFDYAPLSMLITTIPTGIIYTGNLPPELTPQLTDGNGLVWDIGDLDGNSVFTIEFKLQVTEFNSIFQDNLAKLDLLSSDGTGYSIRDSVAVAIATSNPNLQSLVTATTTPINSAALNSIYDYTVTATNFDLTSSGNPTSTIYNSTITIDLPPELSFYNNGLPDVTPIATVSGAIVGTGTIVSPTQYVLPITELSPDGEITITFQGLVSSALVAKNDYIVTSTMTQGTTDLNPPYDNYPGANLTANSTIIAKNISLSKIVVPSTVPLLGGYSTTVTVTVPAGIIVYNTKLKDTTIANNNSLVTNVYLNGTPPSGGYTIVNNILSVNLGSVIDASSGAIAYTLSFNDVATNFTQSNIDIEGRQLTTTSNWGDTPSTTNVFNRSINTFITVVSPNLSLNKLQSNITAGEGYTEDTLIGKENDECRYKFIIENTGYSSAYNLILSDTLPQNINFVGFVDGYGSYDNVTRVLTFNIPILSPSATTEISFDVSINITSPASYIIANNNGNVQYDSTQTATTHFDTLSNSVRLVNNPVTIEKLQKNPTTSTDFVTTPEAIVKGQQILYKIIVSNVGNDELTNLNIQDIFPPDLTFVSFDPFSAGVTTVTNNNISATINSLMPGTTLELIYTVQMNRNVLKTYSTNASLNYSILGESTIFSKVSNTLVTSLYGMGRGYTSY